MKGSLEKKGLPASWSNTTAQQQGRDGGVGHRTMQQRREGEGDVGTGRTWEWVVFLLASWACCVRVRKTHRQALGARDLHQLCRTKQPTAEAKGYVTAGWVYVKRASVGDDCQIRRGSRSSRAKETVAQRIARDSVRRRLSQTSARQGHIKLDEDDQS
jgi:hypothetical protein